MRTNNNKNLLIKVVLVSIALFSGRPWWPKTNHIVMISAQGLSGQVCLEHVCEQTVTGRNLPYARVLEIIHTKAYLRDIDLGVVSSASASTSSTSASMTQQAMAAQLLNKPIRPHPHHSRRRKKRQAATAASSTSTFMQATGINGAQVLYSIPFFLMSLLFVSALRRKPKVHHTTTTTYLQPEPVVHPVPVPVIPEPVAPPIILQTSPPLIPGNVPQPGYPGGGLDPDLVPNHAILSLVPEGLVPLAVFPDPGGGAGLYTSIAAAAHNSDCVLFAEPDPIQLFSYEPYLTTTSARRLRRSPSARRTTMSQKRGRKKERKKKDLKEQRKKRQPRNEHIIEIPAFERFYGFRCHITFRKACPGCNGHQPPPPPRPHFQPNQPLDDGGGGGIGLDSNKDHHMMAEVVKSMSSTPKPPALSFFPATPSQYYFGLPHPPPPGFYPHHPLPYSYGHHGHHFSHHHHQTTRSKGHPTTTSSTSNVYNPYNSMMSKPSPIYYDYFKTKAASTKTTTTTTAANKNRRSSSPYIRVVEEFHTDGNPQCHVHVAPLPACLP